MRFTEILKSLGNRVIGKRLYQGIINGGLPINENAWNGTDFLRAFEISLYVNKALTKRSEKVGEIEFVLRDNNNEIIDDTKGLLDILYKPNPLLTGRQFWGLWQNYFDIYGATYIFVERGSELFGPKNKILGLHLLRPDLVKPFFNDDGTVSKYEYKQENGETTTYQGEQVLYIYRPDPRNPLKGMSLLKAGINAIQTETQISTYHARVLANGGKVESMFKFNTTLNKEQLGEIKDQYRKEYAGAKKSGTPLFVGGDADYKRLGLTPEELSFLEAKKVTLEDICILTSVPKAILASFDDIQYSNAEASIRVFLRETIRPQLQTLATALDEMLFPDKSINLGFVDPTPENVEEGLKMIESGIKNSYMTINEARSKQGLDPVDGGDKILVPFNMIPLGEDISAGGTKSIFKKGEVDHPLKDADIRRVYWKMQIKRLDTRERRFRKTVDTYFDNQMNKLIDTLEPTVTRTFRRKDLLNEIFNLELELQIGKDLFGPVLEELLKQAGIDALSFIGSTYEFNFTGAMAGWLDSRQSIFLRQINETTFKELKNQFEQSLELEESRDKLIRRIKDTYGNIKKSRATMIARTEVHNVTQYGTIEGYKQAGLTTKIWVAVLDSETRPSHAYLDGEEKPIDVPFSNGLMFPGDPAGPADEVINCRCVV